MVRTAGFHDKQRRIVVEEPMLELATRQSMLFDNTPRGVSHGQFEHVGHEGYIPKTLPSRDIGETGHLELVQPRRPELPMNLIHQAWFCPPAYVIRTVLPHTTPYCA